MYERDRNGCVVFGVPSPLSAKRRPVGGYSVGIWWNTYRGIYGGKLSMVGERYKAKAKNSIYSCSFWERRREKK